LNRAFVHSPRGKTHAFICQERVSPRWALGDRDVADRVRDEREHVAAPPRRSSPRTGRYQRGS
jgi:hypothetical protein